jgi:hypothetical protein
VPRGYFRSGADEIANFWDAHADPDSYTEGMTMPMGILISFLVP